MTSLQPRWQLLSLSQTSPRHMPSWYTYVNKFEDDVNGVATCLHGLCIVCWSMLNLRPIYHCFAFQNNSIFSFQCHPLVDRHLLKKQAWNAWKDHGRIKRTQQEPFFVLVFSSALCLLLCCADTADRKAFFEKPASCYTIRVTRESTDSSLQWTKNAE